MEYTEPLTNHTMFEVSTSGSVTSNEYQSLSGEKVVDEKVLQISPTKPIMFASRFGLWKCKRCGKEDKSRSAIKDHVRTHLSSNSHIYFCSVCGKSYQTKNSLRLHKYKIHASEKLIQQLSLVI